MSDVSAPSRLIAVARTRHVPRLLGSSLLGRLPGGMAALAVVLLVRERGGSYAFAGLLAAVYAAGTAIGGPSPSLRTPNRPTDGPSRAGSSPRTPSAR